MGFDTEYFRESDLSSLIIQALRDERVILTRNHHFPKKTGIKIIHIQSEIVQEELRQALKELNVAVNRDIMFTRCNVCNCALEPLNKENARGKVPEQVYQTQNSFFTCPKCKRIYWQGTHWGNITEILKEIT